MKKALNFLIVVFMLVYYSCQTKEKTCNKIPNEFGSYGDAMEVIRNSTYNYTDSVNIIEKDYRLSIYYLSCDRKIGYFLGVADGYAEFFTKGVPIDVWQKFKKNGANHKFYMDSIIGKFQGIKIVAVIDTINAHQ